MEGPHSSTPMVRMIATARSWKDEPKAGEPSHQANPVWKKMRVAQDAKNLRLVEAIGNDFPPHLQKDQTVKQFVKLQDKLQVEMDGRVLKEGSKDNPGKVRKKVLKLKHKVQLGGGKRDECNTMEKITKLSKTHHGGRTRELREAKSSILGMKCHLVSFGGGEIFASKRGVIQGCANVKVKRNETSR